MTREEAGRKGGGFFSSIGQNIEIVFNGILFYEANSHFIL
jgi:hypothetical protein